MLCGRTSTLLTDHNPLIVIFASKKEIPVYTGNRSQRWATTLLSYDFNIKYQSANTISQVDALSQSIGVKHHGQEDMFIASILVDLKIQVQQQMLFETLQCRHMKSGKKLSETQSYEKLEKFTQKSGPQVKLHRAAEVLPAQTLSIIEDCPPFSERFINPKKLQPALFALRTSWSKSHESTNTKLCILAVVRHPTGASVSFVYEVCVSNKSTAESRAAIMVNTTVTVAAYTLGIRWFTSRTNLLVHIPLILLNNLFIDSHLYCTGQ